MVKVVLRAADLQRLLAKMNKSQNWLAFRMQISSGYMSQLMSGQRRPSPRMREKFLSALQEFQECGFDDLFRIEKGSDGRKGRGRRCRAS